MGDYANALAAADRGIALRLDSPQQDNAGFLYTSVAWSTSSANNSPTRRPI
jgi:hypothetical protein